MRQTYKILAHIIAGFVAVQAAVMVFAVAGLGVWIADGNTLTEAAFEGDNPPDFTGAIGFFLHFVFGMMLIPLLALLLLIISFFAKIPGGVKWAAIIVGLVVLQIALGIFGHETPYAGLLHGLNALILFTTALLAGRRVVTSPADVASPYEDAAVR
jgi:hypothetical protein